MRPRRVFVKKEKEQLRHDDKQKYFNLFAHIFEKRP